jgi:hypothetical protein
MRYYVSGQITGLTPEVFRKRFDEASDWLRRMGAEVVNPLEVGNAYCSCRAEEVGPNGTDSSFTHFWGCYLKADLREMLTCNCIAMLPGWHVSRGAQLELQVAVACGLKVFLLKPTPRLPIYEGPPLFTLEPMS